MDLWARAFAALYDRAMAGVEAAGLADHRRRLLRVASGRVLEIGGGTGANLSFYDRAVTELVLAEPEEPMARRLEGKLRGYPIPTRVVRAAAEQLPFDDGEFDCVVSTLVLCTVSDAARALEEVRRVLRPDGRLLFVEHVRSDDPALARWQDLLRRPWSWVGHGCQTNRRTVESIRAAGFDVGELGRERLAKLPPIVAPLAVGVATRGA